jgi:hypothetical protein
MKNVTFDWLLCVLLNVDQVNYLEGVFGNFVW